MKKLFDKLISFNTPEERMDRFEARTVVERAFAKKDKNALSQSLKPQDFNLILEILWDYMIEADGSHLNKRELEELKQKIRKLNDQSGHRVKCLKVLPGRRALVQMGPLREEVIISPSVNINLIKTGTEALVVGGQKGRMLAYLRDEDVKGGKITKVQRVVDDHRIAIEEGSSAAVILTLADGIKCKEGDEVRYDSESKMVFEVIEASEASEFMLENLPKQKFKDVKGLEKEKEYINERLIYPIVYKEKFEKYGIPPIKAALFHGPSGCGKTFIAGAIFNEIMDLKAQHFSKLKDKTDTGGFFNINGPEILSKWSGQSELAIRKIFAQARLAAEKSEFPSIIFWDEIDSIARKRRDSETYSPEKTIVPTLLTEIHGLNDDHNVILIAATNMPNLIDPALMRPGRLGDLILEIPNPSREAGGEIIQAEFNKKFIPEILQELIKEELIKQIISHIYKNDKALANAKLRNGKTKPIMRNEIINGAIFTKIGEEILRYACMAEINKKEYTLKDLIEIVDNLLYSQIGILDSTVKYGFTVDNSDLVIDVAINA